MEELSLTSPTKPSSFDAARTGDALLAALHCSSFADRPPSGSRVTRVLVVGEGADLGRTVLALFADHDVAWLCPRGGLSRLDRDERLLLGELVAEDELQLIEERRLARVSTDEDGRCVVCLDGPRETCSRYDEVVVCGEQARTCRAPSR